MPKALEPGEYVIGDLEADGHTHKFVVGEHIMDVEYPDENMSLVSGDYPRATGIGYIADDYGPHAHSMTAHPSIDKTLVCGNGTFQSSPHIHTTVTKTKTEKQV